MTGQPLPPPSRTPPGWFPDPFDASGWRWWDGHRWTQFAAPATAQRKPRLPRWLSVPVVVALPIAVIAIVVIGIQAPIAIITGLVPLAIVLPTFVWLDRVEPEPWSSRLHALLWGGTVAIVVSAIVNAVVAEVGGVALAAVVSAPLIEETTKGLGVWWALRRREIDGVMDGVVYAGWVALGFAVVEDFEYFARADQTGDLFATFVLRAVLLPFAHPLFTIWIGLAIGRAVMRGQGMDVRVLWGFALAVLSHFAWNGSLALAGYVGAEDESTGAAVVGVAALVFVGLFMVVGAMMIRMRRREQREFITSIPMLSTRFGLTDDEQQWFLDWRHMLRQRRKMSREQRRRFDAVHAALARLSMIEQGRRPNDAELERILAQQLHDARSG